MNVVFYEHHLARMLYREPTFAKLSFLQPQSVCLQVQTCNSLSPVSQRTMEAANQNVFGYAVCVLGECKVGKTSFIERLMHDRFDVNEKPTNPIGEQYRCNHEFMLNKDLKISLRMFDFNIESFNKIDQWKNRILCNEYVCDAPILLLGNKLDLHLDSNNGQRINLNKMGIEEYAKSNDMVFHEISAAKSIGIHGSIRDIVLKKISEQTVVALFDF